MKVKDYLRSGKVKWVNRQPQDFCETCLFWAIATCYREPKEMWEIDRRVREFLGIESIPKWNDAPGRKFEDVLDVADTLDF